MRRSWSLRTIVIMLAQKRDAVLPGVPALGAEVTLGHGALQLVPQL